MLEETEGDGEVSFIRQRDNTSPKEKYNSSKYSFYQYDDVDGHEYSRPGPKAEIPAAVWAKAIAWTKGCSKEHLRHKDRRFWDRELVVGIGLLGHVEADD